MKNSPSVATSFLLFYVVNISGAKSNRLQATTRGSEFLKLMRWIKFVLHQCTYFLNDVVFRSREAFSYDFNNKKPFINRLY